MARGESGMFWGCTWSMPGWELGGGGGGGGGATCKFRSPLRDARRRCPGTEAGDTGLPLFLRAEAVVECTELPSLGECAVPSVSATDMSAAMGDGPFWGAVSGGVVRLEWGPRGGGGGPPVAWPGVAKPPADMVSFRASLWLAIHCCLCCCSSPSLRVPSAESGGSGEAFLLRRLAAVARPDGVVVVAAEGSAPVPGGALGARLRLTSAVGSMGQLASR